MLNPEQLNPPTVRPECLGCPRMQRKLEGLKGASAQYLQLQTEDPNQTEEDRLIERITALENDETSTVSERYRQARITQLKSHLKRMHERGDSSLTQSNAEALNSQAEVVTSLAAEIKLLQDNCLQQQDGQCLPPELEIIEQANNLLLKNLLDGGSDKTD